MVRPNEDELLPPINELMTEFHDLGNPWPDFGWVGIRLYNALLEMA